MSSASVAEQPVHGSETDNAGKVDLVLQGGGLPPCLGLSGEGLELLLHDGSYKTNFMHGWIASQLSTTDRTLCMLHTRYRLP
jgi:hypothetical protein